MSFPPLYAITHTVAGEDAYVLSMLTTEGPHGYEGNSTDVLKVNKADLYIHNGLTLDDDFTDRMLRNRSRSKLAILNIGTVLDERDYDIVDPKEKLLIRGKPVKHGNHWHGPEDPHYWLGPRQAMAMTEIIAAKLGELDPPNSKKYEARAAEYVKELKELQSYGETALADKKNKKIITMHDGFKYFAEAFGIKIVDTVQSHPGDDPEATRMAKLIKACKNENVVAIAVEPQYSRAQAEAIQRTLKRDGIDIQIIELDPLETTSAARGSVNPDPKYFVQKMRANIDALAKALR